MVCTTANCGDIPWFVAMLTVYGVTSHIAGVIYIYKAEKLSVCLSTFHLGPL